MRTYEELFIVRPDVTDEELDPLVEQMRTVITNGKGTLDKVEKWGVRKLAYRIDKRAEGYYVLLGFSADSQLVRELERRLRVSDLVMKFLTVRTDEKLKRAAKLKKKKDARAARKPAPPVQPAAPLFGEPASEIARPGLPNAAAPGAPAPAAPAPAAPAPAAPEQQES